MKVVLAILTASDTKVEVGYAEAATTKWKKTKDCLKNYHTMTMTNGSNKIIE